MPGDTSGGSVTCNKTPLQSSRANLPGPLAGIDEGDKVRTIHDGSVGGANDIIRNQTVERTTAPTVLDGVQAFHWLAAEGPPSQGASGPGWGTVSLNHGDGSGLAPGGCCSRRTSPRVKVLQMDWRFQVASLGDEWWVNKGHLRHGQCSVVLGTPGGPPSQNLVRALPSSRLALRVCG